MFNHHSTEQNVGWERDVEKLMIVYKTLRDIMEGEELCEQINQFVTSPFNFGTGISYGGRLWFQDTDARQDTAESENGSDILNSIQID
jgi:SET domain-containing protein